MYSKRFKSGDTTYPTQAFIEKGWVIIHQSEVVHSGHNRPTSTSSVVSIPITDFLKMVETLKEETQ